MKGSFGRWCRTAGALALTGALFGGVVVTTEASSAGAASGLKASRPVSPRKRSRSVWSPKTGSDASNPYRHPRVVQGPN